MSGFWDAMTAERPINRKFISYDDKVRNYESKIHALQYEVQKLKGEISRLRNINYQLKKDGEAALNTPTDLNDILRASAAFCDMTPEDIKSKTRVQKYVRARVLFMVKARNHGHSLKAIGRFIGRDHSTVIHAIDNKYKHLDDMDIQFTQL